MDEDKLFTALRKLSALSQIQVDSVHALLQSCNKHGVTDPHQIAYVLATAYHESGLKPIEEIGRGAGHPYGKSDATTGQTYYGRGFVQLTWKGNYQEFSDLLHVDLVRNPKLALNPDIAAEIAVIGMKNGLFTGVSLRRYFTGASNDPINARKIINGLDRAEHIAGFYNVILQGLI